MAEPFTPEAARGLAEVMAKPDATPSASGLSPTQFEIVEAAQGDYQAGRTEDALERLQGGDVVPHTKQENDEVLVERLSTERDKVDGKKVAPTAGVEKTRYNDASKEVEMVREALEKGKYSTKMVQQVEEFLYKHNPIFKNLIDEAGGLGKIASRDLIRKLMENSDFHDELLQIYNDRLDPTVRLDQEADVSRLKVDVIRVKAELGNPPTQTEIDSARTELQTAKADYNVNAGPKQIKLKTLQRRYQILTNTMPQLEMRKISLEARYLTLESQLTPLEAKFAGMSSGDPDYSTTKTDIDNIKKDGTYVQYTTIETQIQEHTDIETKIGTLTGEIGTHQAAVDEKNELLEALKTRSQSLTPEQRAAKTAELASLKAALADAKSLLNAEMVGHNRDLTHMTQDAMANTVEQTFPKLKEAWRERATRAQTAKESVAQSAGRKMNGVWCEERDEKVSFIDRKLWRKSKGKVRLPKLEGSGGVREHLQNVLTGDPEALLAKIEKMSDIDIEKKTGMSNTEVLTWKEMIKNDSEFREEQADLIAKDALADYLSSGGEMSRDVVTALVRKDFGKNLITQGMSKAEDILKAFPEQQKALQELKDLNPPEGLTAHLEKNWKKYATAILILLAALSLAVVT